MQETHDFRLYHGSRRGLYIEFQPGTHRGKHWLPNSRMLYEPTFWYLASVFKRHLSDFNHYGPNVITRDQWIPILNDLDQIRRQTNKKTLQKLIAKLTEWLRKTLKQHSAISILGV
jgi:hypothetical protein